jgi:hypothetical protein
LIAFGHTTFCGQCISPQSHQLAWETGELPQERVGLPIAFFRCRGVTKMPLINLVVALIVVGMALWLVNRYIPMASSIKTILNVVVVVAVGVFVLKSAGLWGDVTSFRIGH